MAKRSLDVQIRKFERLIESKAKKAQKKREIETKKNKLKALKTKYAKMK